MCMFQKCFQTSRNFEQLKRKTLLEFMNWFFFIITLSNCKGRKSIIRNKIPHFSRNPRSSRRRSGPSFSWNRNSRLRDRRALSEKVETKEDQTKAQFTTLSHETWLVGHQLGGEKGQHFYDAFILRSRLREKKVAREMREKGISSLSIPLHALFFLLHGRGRVWTFKKKSLWKIE